MALVGKECKQVVERIRYHVDCDSWLDEGETLSGVTGLIDLCDGAVVDGIQIDHTYRGFHYFVTGGALNDQFNVIFSQTTSFGQTRFDHVQFNIGTNGGFVSDAATSQLMLSIVGATGPTGPGSDDLGASIIEGDGDPPPGGVVGEQILVGDGDPT